jgi:cyclophilin family peptidyl-prolyl cis-trans isomerase
MRVIKLLLALVLIGGGGGAAYLHSKGELLPMLEGFGVPVGQMAATAGEEAESSQPSAAAPATEAPKENSPPGGAPMSANFDLTPDAEGLSKAVATMTLESGGVVKWRFFTNDAPNTVRRISQLVGEGFYNGIIFHRVVPGFVVQAGDPTGLGSGGSGVKLNAEFNSHKHVSGIVSMARTNDPNSADSQFFIMLGPSPHLDGKYTVIGKVIEGLENVQKIRQGDKIKTFTIQ